MLFKYALSTDVFDETFSTFEKAEERLEKWCGGTLPDCTERTNDDGEKEFIYSSCADAIEGTITRKRVFHVQQVAYNVPSSIDGPHLQYRDGFDSIDECLQYISSCSRINFESLVCEESVNEEDVLFVFEEDCEEDILAKII